MKPLSPARQAWLAFVAVVLCAVLLRTRTWGVDGAIHTNSSAHFMDLVSYGHFLLRPIAFTLAQVGRACGLVDPGQTYWVLWSGFLLLGAAGTALAFRAAVECSGARGAWLALIVVGVTRGVLRQLAVLDEKAVGLFFLGLAIYATAVCLRDGKKWSGLIIAAVCWMVAAFGHLQNCFYALAFVVLVAAHPAFGATGGERIKKALVCAGCMVAVACVLFPAVHWQFGGFRAFGPFLHDLLGGPKQVEARGHFGIVRSIAEGLVKAFFNLDRTSAKWAVGLAFVGFLLIVAGVGTSLLRRRHPLVVMLVLGMTLHALSQFVMHAYPDYGDSYTALVLAALVPLACAPRILALGAAGVIVLVNVPAQVRLSFPAVTMQQELIAMQQVPGPWVILDELAAPNGEQEFTPFFYPMRNGLVWNKAKMSTLPAGAFNVEIPLGIERDGTVRNARVNEIEEQFTKAGRVVRRGRLWPQDKLIPSDMRVYGNYLSVAAR